MSLYLGLDTSNYTTSAALYDTEKKQMIQAKQVLPVKQGEKGLRQSDAVFHHTVQLPELVMQLDISGKEVNGIGVSVRPRNAEGSYMPCFLCGAGAADMLGHVLHIPVCKTSHQTGHILAALYAAGKLHWRKKNFLAFHVSGGTTECVLCAPDKTKILNIQAVSSSLDLKAGQLIDRVGLLLGLEFPCGAQLEKLAAQSRKEFHYQPVMKQLDCCLSGLENQCAKALQNGLSPCDTALFCLTAIAEVLREMTERALLQYHHLPVLYAGGVMSNQYLQQKLGNYIVSETAFAEPAFSCDNAAGTAVYAAIHGSPDSF